MSIKKLQAILELKKEIGDAKLNYEQVREEIGREGLLMDTRLKAIFREHVRVATALSIDVDSIEDTIDFLERLKSTMELPVIAEELNELEVLHEVCESLDSLDANADYRSMIDDIMNGFSGLNIVYDLDDMITDRLTEAEDDTEILTLAKCLRKLSIIK